MNELKRKYIELRAKALKLMSAGKVNAYLATLVEVNDLRMRLVQVDTAK